MIQLLYSKYISIGGQKHFLCVKIVRGGGEEVSMTQLVRKNIIFFLNISFSQASPDFSRTKRRHWPQNPAKAQVKPQKRKWVLKDFANDPRFLQTLEHL